ncbi:MAG: hypothetical protein PHH04_03555 [Thomasclavelia sp.]|jgi:hypothetical protein|nr:hypothetical protein [Thomasclavelia sp.]
MVRIEPKDEFLLKLMYMCEDYTNGLSDSNIEEIYDIPSGFVNVYYQIGKNYIEHPKRNAVSIT